MMMTREEFFSHLVTATSGNEQERRASQEGLASHVFGSDYKRGNTDSALLNMYEAVLFIAERGERVFKAMDDLLKAGHKPREAKKNHDRTVQDIELAYKAMMWIQSR